MGGNGSFDEEYGGVPEYKRTHTEIEGHTIMGHKVLVPTNNPTRGTAPMNCNTANQIYIIGSVNDKRSGDKAGEIKVSSVAFYDGQHISYSVDVKYDSSGKISQYRENTGESTTHAHQWHEVKPGVWGRISRAKDNHHCPDSRWNAKLTQAIESFNSKGIKWEK
ncbi:MAG: hypothetical protein K2M69_09540 [Muribaculaceae bacterium]|nr:hypothetical protein [Muribaculaceae bacterium]